MKSATTKSVICIVAFLFSVGAWHAWTHFIAGQKLLDAVGNGDVESVRRLLSFGASADVTDEDGATPLLNYSRLAGDTIYDLLVERFHAPPQEIGRLLLRNGADPNAVNDGGWASIHFAVAKQNWGLARLLVESGADPNLPIDYEIALFNWEFVNGWTALHFLASHTYSGPDEVEQARDAIRHLIENGGSLDTTDYDNRTPMMLAEARGNLNVFDSVSKAPPSGEPAPNP